MFDRVLNISIPNAISLLKFTQSFRVSLVSITEVLVVFDIVYRLTENKIFTLFFSGG